MVRAVTPQVYLFARPQLDLDAMNSYLQEIDCDSWLDKSYDPLLPDGQTLIEFAGRACYRSWQPGANANVTKIRADQTEYLTNILSSKHGSVLEHANYTFAFLNVSRVFTHELVRHRAGVAISQESMRFVRLTDIPFWFPEWAQADDALMAQAQKVLDVLEGFQLWMAEHFNLDAPGVPFHEKKHKTSFMRRFAPDGVATTLVWTANVRALRHIIEARTSPGAEEEIRLVFDQVAQLMQTELPALFADFTRADDGAWTPKYSKV